MQKYYAPKDETRTMIRKVIQEREAPIDSSISLPESTRNQNEIALKAMEWARLETGARAMEGLKEIR